VQRADRVAGEVRNIADEVVVRVRSEKVGLTGHRGMVGMVELPEEIRRCAVRVQELAVASSALETLPEWLGELALSEVLRLGYATIVQLEEVLVGNRDERKREGCNRQTVLPDGIRVLTAPVGRALGADDAAEVGTERVSFAEDGEVIPTALWFSGY
jgi:hypothetical protein